MVPGLDRTNVATAGAVIPELSNPVVRRPSLLGQIPHPLGSVPMPFSRTPKLSETVVAKSPP
jgi:hypothetical protein